jgi:hypothetical protein
LTTIRQPVDWLVIDLVVPRNPAASVSKTLLRQFFQLL